MRTDVGTRHAIALLAGAFIFASAPPLIEAQSLPGWVDPALVEQPSVGGEFDRPLCAPTVRQGGGLKFLAGYMDYAKGLNLSFEPTTDGYAPAIALERWYHNYPLRGLWLSLEAGLPLTAGFGVYASGAYLVPSAVYSEEFVYWNGGQGSRTWSTSSQWYSLDLAGTYSAAGATQVIGGVRYDSFSTKYSKPTNLVNLAALPTDEAEMRVGLVLPYVGVAVTQGSQEALVKVKLVGFPLVPGEAWYGETYGLGAVGQGSRNQVSGTLNRGYFAELSAEAARGFGGDRMMLGVFGKYHHLQARADLRGNYYSVGFPTESDTFQFNIQRQAWIVGISAGIGF